jgi:hypothetical protein
MFSVNLRLIAKYGRITEIITNTKNAMIAKLMATSKKRIEIFRRGRIAFTLAGKQPFKKFRYLPK